MGRLDLYRDPRWDLEALTLKPLLIESEEMTQMSLSVRARGDQRVRQDGARSLCLFVCLGLDRHGRRRSASAGGEQKAS